VKKPGTGSPVLCGDPVKAVRREAEVAVAHHFGVHKSTVRSWRRALGVGRVTEGTHRLASAIADARTDDRLARARANSKNLSQVPPYRKWL
jgi:transposase-like protein